LNSRESDYAIGFPFIIFLILALRLMLAALENSLYGKAECLEINLGFSGKLINGYSSIPISSLDMDF
jgi:hypothetical protein